VLPSIVFDWSELVNHLLESLEPAEIFGGARNLERFDYVARHNYGFGGSASGGGCSQSPHPNDLSGDQDHIA